MLLQYWLSFCQFGTYLWSPRKSAPDEPPATAASEAAVVVDRPVEETTVVGKAVVDQQLHARHVVEPQGGMIGMKGWPTLPGATCCLVQPAGPSTPGLTLRTSLPMLSGSGIV